MHLVTMSLFGINKYSNQLLSIKNLTTRKSVEDKLNRSLLLNLNSIWSSGIEVWEMRLEAMNGLMEESMMENGSLTYVRSVYWRGFQGE